jgi:DNA-binding NarL/FixJ family response regulator
MRRARVLLADDHRMVAEGLRSLLEPEFELVGIVENGRALIEAVEQLRPDVIVADVSMPLLNGIEAVRQIKKNHENIKVVFLTMHPDITYAVSAFEAGALGYVLKHSAPAELSVAIRQALAGKKYVTPLLTGISDYFLNGQTKNLSKRKGKTSLLTPRQREVLQLLAEGHSVKEIASRLEISSRTVEYHKYQMIKSLGMKTVADLVRYAVKLGIVSE